MRHLARLWPRSEDLENCRLSLGSFFDAPDRQFPFTLDPCATHANAKCRKHYTTADDGLAQDWGTETLFMNPPYGRGILFWIFWM